MAQRAAGLVLQLIVVCIWVGSAEVTQKIYEAYRQPFVLTYLGVSLMAIWLPLSLIVEWLWHSRLKEWIVSRFHKRDRRMQKTTSDLEANGISSWNVFQDSEHEALEEEQPLVNLISAEKSRLSEWEVAKACLALTPLWFVTEYLTNSALANTSVASTTILGSSSGLFTLIFSILLGQDKFNVWKLVSALITIIGVAMTTLGSTWAANEARPRLSSPSEHDMVGDFCALIAAVTNSLFFVSLKKLGGQVEVEKIWGYIGLWTLIGLWWLVWPLHALKVEPSFSMPKSLKLDEFVVLNCLFGSVLSDYLWGKSVVWTSPLIATLAMSLTIPGAMMADMIVHGRHFSSMYILGSAQVIAGFFIANLTESCSRTIGF